MSNIITDIRVIKPEHWSQEVDGLWYVHIPFEAHGEDTLMEFVDPDEYVQAHKEDFDALNSGFTTDKECTITADHKPSCDMSVQIKFCKDEDGEIVYKPNEKGEFKPEWRSNPKSSFGALAGLMGGLGGTPNFDPSQIIDAKGKIINQEEPKQLEESKDDGKKIIV